MVKAGGEKFEELEEFKYQSMFGEGKEGIEMETKDKVVEGIKVMGSSRKYGRSAESRRKKR